MPANITIKVGPRLCVNEKEGTADAEKYIQWLADEVRYAASQLDKELYGWHSENAAIYLDTVASDLFEGKHNNGTHV